MYPTQHRTPAYILLFRLGKKVLRPGGRSLSKELVASIILHNKQVLEIAPGFGTTTDLIVSKKPASYNAIEINKEFAKQFSKRNPHLNTIISNPAVCKFSENSFDIVICESFLTVQPDYEKRKVLNEIYRILKPGGFYVLHEIAVKNLNHNKAGYKSLISEMRRTLQVSATPLLVSDWKNIGQEPGFSIVKSIERPMAFLNNKRIMEDEGFYGVIKILGRLLLNPVAIATIIRIKKLFQKHNDNLIALGLILQKK